MCRSFVVREDFSSIGLKGSQMTSRWYNVTTVTCKKHLQDQTMYGTEYPSSMLF